MRMFLLFLFFSILHPQSGKCGILTQTFYTYADSTYSGDAQAAYIIEGRKVNIKSNLQADGQTIIALHVNQVIRIEKTNFVRVNFTNSLTHEVFDFVIADQGRTVVRHFKPRLTNGDKIKAVYMSSDLVNYYAETVKIAVTSMDARHVTGTFSGKFIADDGKAIHISSGHFDMPFKSGSL